MEKFKYFRELVLVMQKITVIKIRRSRREDNINDELKWLGSSLGLFGLRDRDSSCFRVFITLLKKTRKNEPTSSDEIAEKLKLSRGTVVHHLTKLMNSGLAVKEREGYLLKEATLEGVIEEMKRELERLFEELKEVAKEVDEKLG